MQDSLNPWGAAAPMLEFLVKAGLVWLAGTAAAIAWRNAAAAARESVWRWTSVGVLVLPIAIVFAPRWAPLSMETVAVRVEETATRSPALDASVLAGPYAVPRASTERVASPSSVALDPPASSIAPAWPRAALAIWLGGAALVLWPALAGLWALRRLRREGVPVDSGPWHEELGRAVEVRQIAKRVDLVRSAELAVPMIWEGAPGRAALLAIPSASAGWSRARVRSALAHELGHLVRHDGWAGLAARTALALSWPWPVAWWGWRRLLAESERACDDLVLASGERPSRYAEHLLALAGEAQGRWSPATPMARRDALTERVDALLDEGRPRTSGRRVTALVGAGCLAVVAPLGALATQEQVPGPAKAPAIAQEADGTRSPVERALDRGLARLVALQDPETGAWLGDVGYKLNRSHRAIAEGVPHVGVTALALEALLASGATLGEGPLGVALERGAAFLVRAQETDPGHVQAHGSRMKSHGLATAVLARIAARTGDSRLKEAAQAAVDFTLIAGAIGPGWRYTPLTSESDLLNTAFQVQALKAARDAGLRVPQANLDFALAHVLEHREEGNELVAGPGFRYQVDRHARLTVSTSASGLLALAGEGRLEAGDALAVMNRLRTDLPEHTRFWSNHYLGWTGRWLAAQAIRAASAQLDCAEIWEADREALRTELLKLQLPDGSWPCSEGPGVAFSTAVACHLLQL